MPTKRVMNILPLTIPIILPSLLTPVTPAPGLHQLPAEITWQPWLYVPVDHFELVFLIHDLYLLYVLVQIVEFAVRICQTGGVVPVPEVCAFVHGQVADVVVLLVAQSLVQGAFHLIQFRLCVAQGVDARVDVGYFGVEDALYFG